MDGTNPRVDGYLRKSNQWQRELRELRRIILDCRLAEEVKWRVPCYTFQGRNIVIIGRFKESCVLSFVKGALLKDAERILVKPGENTQAARVIRFTDVRRILELESILRAYIHEAIEVEKAGLKVKLEKNPEAIPEEFRKRLDDNPQLKAAFAALTPGRRRAYILYFSGAKRSTTRELRVEKCVARILQGKSLED